MSRLEQLAQQFDVSAGAIELVMRNVAQARAALRDGEEAGRMVSRLLNAHLSMCGHDRAPLSESSCVGGDYSIEGLTISGDLTKTLRVIDSFNQRWQDHDQSMSPKSLGMILYGPPGTGKTEFARYLARRLKRPLEAVWASDVLDRWVGSTEKHIRAAFERAMRRGAILFLDEVDSLLSNRSMATQSWQVTQVNELLTAIDQYRGLLVAATNNRAWLDQAALRRFSIKLGFEYLDTAGTHSFYRRVLAPLCPTPLSEPQQRRLAALTRLTPGDMRNVYQTHCFLSPHDITHDSLLHALEQELSVKDGGAGRRMGFA